MSKSRRSGASFLMGMGLLMLWGARAAPAGEIQLKPLEQWHQSLWTQHSDKGPGDHDHFYTLPCPKFGTDSIMIDSSSSVTVGQEEKFSTMDLTFEPVAPGDVYAFSCWVKGEDVRGGTGAYVALGAFNSKDGGRRLSDNDSAKLAGTQDWTPMECVLVVPPGADKLVLYALLAGNGRVSFNKPRLALVSRNAPIGGKTVEVNVSRKPIRDDFLGFGFEDDPFFFTSFNYRNDVDEADAVIRERRIHALHPAVARAFLFWDAFNPGHNLTTITYRTELMDSLYRTLDVYQKMGVPVNLCNTYWGWENKNFPFRDERVEKGVQVYLRVLKHLIKDKGYTCIKYITLGNEPDLFWTDWDATFASHIKASRLIKAGLAQNGLQDLIFVGGDVAENFDWLKDAIRQADDCFGEYSLHKYINVKQFPLLDYYLDKAMGIVAENAKPVTIDGKKTTKPVFLWEFGYQGDQHTSTSNDEMRGYPYGLLGAYTCMGVMNHGLTGTAVWCLHSMFYVHQIAERMDYGLWDFKDNGWKLRPVYWSFGLFSCLFEKGMKPVEVSQEPQTVQLGSAALLDAQGNLIVYLLNMSDNPVRVHLSNVPPKRYAVYQFSQGRLPKPGDPRYESIESLRLDKPWDSTSGVIEVGPQSLLALK